ncbi:hypothetical protein SAMN04490244_11810 [Tranquillimonas rosea]|uniref:Uncharacterized protein n=1 Tax=Tranquillimonas rosea TaxID=641238 RepID=A0A1H9X5B7_9RHOB|nr:hypothetical protein SAMN04490244_11810 [Tranquillimonas rosea]
MWEGEFFDAFAAIRSLIDEPVLIDNPMRGGSHDLGARILRHGLSVSSFAFLEKYLQEAIKDFMPSASMTPVAYADMNDEFRRFVSISAAEGLLNRASFKPRVDRISYFEAEVSSLAKFGDTPAQFNWHGFSPKGSNVYKEDVATALKALGVITPWAKLTRVTAELGSHRADLASDFDNLSRTRNSSAHNPRGNIPTSDLGTNVTVAVLVAISFSLVLRSLKKVYTESRSVVELRERSRDPSINVRFVDEEGGGRWLERKEAFGRGVKRYRSFEDSVVRAMARSERPSVVVRSLSGIPLRLY